MIPYFSFDKISIGPLQVHTWGLLVGIGIAIALRLAYQRIKKDGLNGNILLDLSVWAIVAAFIGARIVYVLFYNPSFLLEDPISFFKIWQGGLSSFGGFFGAAITSIIYARIKKINFWQYTNVIAFAFPLGLGVGRLGCFFNHLHIGRLNTFFLAVNFPGGSRLDMGLIESLLGFFMFAIYIFLDKLKPQNFFYLPLTMVIYGISRFFLDFGRATDILDADIRYVGLTPAQFGSILLLIGGFFIMHTMNYKYESYPTRTR